jgi:Cu(I)/Ag(I) efflux system membrane fusion protein
MSNTTPPRQFGIGALIGVAIVTAAVIGALAYALSRGPTETPVAAPAPVHKDRYQCPMHPSVVSDHPGDCPICGMKLMKVADAVDAGPRAVLFYRSPMDPKVTSPGPMKDEMGMDFVPVYADEKMGAASDVAGQATVEIDPERQQLIGLATAPVTAGRVGGAWRTVGRVAVDETRLRNVNVKVSGFVEHVSVDFVGKAVRKGDPLFTLYSPELLSTQEEYLLAVKTQKALSQSGALGGDGDTLVSAARRKLMLWDVPVSELDRLARTGVPLKTLTFYSPVSGVVTKKEVIAGMKLEAGAMAYELVDLSQLWVLADVYESELRYVKVGMPATLTLNAYPGKEFKGRVLFVDPLLDPQTRTVKVRLSFANLMGDLKPEMFGEVVLHGAPRKGLRIPQDALVDTGAEQMVFVALGDGKFQPRLVHVGEASGDSVEVVSGLTEGEEVVTRANFLVDSESRLRASLGRLTPSAAAPAPESARVLPGPDAGRRSP